MIENSVYKINETLQQIVIQMVKTRVKSAFLAM